jgi:hypothetical protein
MKTMTSASIIWILCHSLAFLVGIILIQTKGPILTQIGTSAVASGIIGWVVFAYMLFTEGSREKLGLFLRFGLINAFEARSVRIKPEYDSRLANAREGIDILGFGLKALREDYAAEFVKWKQRVPKVRILLLDPEFPNSFCAYARQRDEEEGNSSGSIEADVKMFVKEISGLVSAGSFEIKLYRCLPSVNIFRVDDEMFWGPYLLSGQSRNSPTLIVKRGGFLFQRMTNHFNEIWTNNRFSRSVPDEWIHANQSAS